MRIVLVLLLLFLPTISFAADYTADANCMGAWLMEDDGNETDVSGEGGTIIETSGDIPQDADEKFGTYSRDFEIDDTEYFYHADGLSTDISGADSLCSIVLFIKLESKNLYQAIVTKWDYGGDYPYNQQYRIRLDSDNTFSWTYGDFTTIGSDTALDTGTWYHCAFVYDDTWPEGGTSMHVYLDGSDDSDVATSHTGGNSDTDSLFGVGQYFNDGSPAADRYFDGLMDDVAIFDRELTSVEISDISTNGLGYPYAPPAAGQVIIVN